jgi:hypothetical protein
VKPLRVFLLILCTATLASAGDNDFRAVVHAIEGHYGVHHMHIPLLGVAMFFARPSGVSGLKLAVFEDFDGHTDPSEVRRIIENSLGEEWHPFVRVHSRNDSNADGETTLIYANLADGKMRMMIVNVEPSEATVVELKVDEHGIKRWLREPGEEADNHSGHHPDN